MGGSEEYLAALGFDTSDVDKAVDQTVTLLGHLGAQFDSVSGKSEKAERALLGNAAATKKVGTEVKGLSGASAAADGNLARLRYAVYDVSSALTIGAVAATAFVAGIVGANVAFEREFADVRRTVGVTGDDADRLYDKFIRISTDIPVAFAKLAQIGTLAGQLGVVEDRVASFTQTTAEFSATTDVSVEQSATAFGRLDTLIDGVDGRYRNLASSILNVGINSVATESQIIAIASQIAATGNQAGLTADEVIGLSGSLASLGVAPEAARGTILRFFSQVNSAVSEGGARLNDFATISNMSSDEFRKGWSTDFTSTFLAFLRGIDANGGNAEAAIRSLGITASRDINTLLKLSQNADAVASNLGLAATGFQNAGILAENFSVIAETNASRLQVLIQTVQAFAATVGEATNGPLAGFLDYLQRILESLIMFANTPFGQGIAFFSTILGASLAIMLLLGAASLRTAGSFLALKTAIGETYLQTMLAQGGLRGFTASLFGAAGGAAALGSALKATGVGLLISAGLYLLGEGVAFIGDKMKSGEEQATAYFGSLDGLSDAIKADNVAIFAQRAEDATEAIGGAATSSEHWAVVLENAAQAQQDLAGSTSGSTGSIDQQTLSIGKNTQEWLRNQLASSESFRSIFANLDALKQLSATTLDFGSAGSVTGFAPFDIQAYSDALANGGVNAGTKYIENFKAGVLAAATAADDGSGSLVNAVDGFLLSNEALTKAEEAGVQISNALQSGLSEAAQSDAITSILDNIFGPAETAGEEASAAFRQLTDDVFGVINAEAELSANTQKLGSDFATNGAQVAASGSAMQAVIASIYASSSGAPEAASRMQGLFNALVQGGYASASQLAPLQAIINSLAGGKAVKAAAFDMTNFAGGIDKVTQAAGGGGGGAAKAIRTLVDYANDLRGVLSRSFDIRFGGGQASDDIAAGWNKIRDAITQTNLEIAKYQAEMQQLTADRAVREYWLSVAENYGDALRAGELRAELAEIDNKLASSADDLAKSQSKSSKTLVGNSQAAIDNREEILGLVSGYQSYITALAAAGVPQEQLQSIAAQLKQEFIAQATQLGYNAGELSNYSAALDDVSTALANVPRNITVNANVDPALQALNELEAKVATLNASGGVNIPVTTTGYVDQGARDALFTQWATKTQEQYGMALAQSASGWAYVRQQWAAGAYGNPGFRTGGFTGNLPAWKQAGAVHGREFVLNQRGTSMFPRQVLDAANQGRQVNFGSPQAAPVKFPSVMRVELSPIDRDAIAQGAQVTVVLTADQVGQASSASFGDDTRRGGS